MNTLTAPKLSLTPSYQSRGLVAVASLLITLAVVAGNLQLAQGYADAAPASTLSAEAGRPARA